ncbi:hypothetical protein ES705_32513 [subsurface metagenome]
MSVVGCPVCSSHVWHAYADEAPRSRGAEEAKHAKMRFVLRCSNQSYLMYGCGADEAPPFGRMPFILPYEKSKLFGVII